MGRSARSQASAQHVRQTLGGTFRSGIPHGRGSEGPRTELTKRMQDAKFFPAFTQAASNAQDKTIKRGPDGAWDIPRMVPAHMGGNIAEQTLGGIANMAAGAVGSLVTPITG